MKKSSNNIIYFDIVAMFNLNVITNVVFHLSNKDITTAKDVFYIMTQYADVCIFYATRFKVI